MGLRKQKREPELQDIVRQRLYRDLSPVPQVLSHRTETPAKAVAEPLGDLALSMAGERTLFELGFEPVVERACEPEAAPAEPVLEIRGLVPTGGSLDLTLDFEMREGDLVIIEGDREAAARAWKAMAGIGDTQAGEVRVGGQSQHDLSYSDQAAYRVVAPGVLLEPAVFEPSFTVKENLVSTLLLTGQSPSECEAAASWALSQLGIEAIADAAPAHLDERERALAMMARAIIGDPYVLWIDSPVERFGSTGGRAVLDAAERLRLLEGCAVVMIGESGEFASADARHLVATREGVRVRA